MTEPAVVQPQNLDPHSPSAAAQALQSLQDRPSETSPPEAIKPSSKTLVELEGVTYKRCTHCKELKIRDQNFNKDKSRGDGFACTCKGCANRHTRAWHERHKQQVNVTKHKQQHEHLLLSVAICFRQHTAAHKTCSTTRNLTATQWTAAVQNSVNIAHGGGSLPPQAQCSHCKEFRPRSAFYGDTSQANGLRPHCR